MNRTFLGVVLGLVAAVACSAGGGGEKKVASGGASGASGVNGAGGVGGAINPQVDGGIGATTGGGSDIVTPNCTASCTDWPGQPIADTGSGAPPANAPGLFGAPSNQTPGSFCILEPEAGTLFPANWVRPRFRFTPPPGTDLFEIRLSTPKETNDLVVHTKSSTYAMPKEQWDAVALNVHEEDITVTIRAVSSGSPGTPVAAQTSFRIAPVRARGSMVYWATTSTNKGDQYAWLDGFGVGEEGVIEALRLGQVQFGPVLDQGGNPSGSEANQPTGHVDCIGCHSSTPDGDSVLFTEHWPWSNAIASVEERSVGAVPPYVTEGGKAALKQAWLGATTTASALWNAQQRIVVTSFGNEGPTGWGTAPSSIGQSFSDQPKARLAWINLAAQAPQPPPKPDGAEFISWVAGLQGSVYGFINREGDTRGAMMPDISDDGQKIVYISTNAGKDGRIGSGEADLYTVPYNAGAGGPASGIPGASAAGVGEYYPAFSPDGKLIAFNRVANLGAELYYNKDSEVYVIPTEGGTAERLRANQPPACLNVTSPGIINSWPKWSPRALTVGAKTYYWLIFSSAREPSVQIDGPNVKDPRGSQLYISAVVVEDGRIQSYPAIYIWNQRRTTSNHTPAWDVFKIPPVPPPL